MGEILLLAVASAAWPLLLAVVLIAFGAQHPKRLLGSFLAGGLLATVVIGTIIVHLIQTSDYQFGSKSQSRAAVPLILGAVALLFALVMYRRAQNAQPSVAADDGPGRLVRWLDRGVFVTFLVGFFLNVVPGAFPVLGLKDIAELGYGLAESALIVLVFYVIMFAALEIPLIGFFVDPTRTAEVTRGINEWLRRNKTMIGAGVLLVGGIYLIVRGLIDLAG